MKPILFNTDMVKAILCGRKTQTRRLVHPVHLLCLQSPFKQEHPEFPDTTLLNKLCLPPYRVGDILYVRETFSIFEGRYIYRADCPEIIWNGHEVQVTWRPSIHMPKEAARLFLRVTDARAERLQDITEDGVCQEGAEALITCPNEHPIYNSDGTLGDMCWNTDCCSDCVSLHSYPELFGKIVWNPTVGKEKIEKYGWDANPFVWVITFEKISEGG